MCSCGFIAHAFQDLRLHNLLFGAEKVVLDHHIFNHFFHVGVQQVYSLHSLVSYPVFFKKLLSTG